MKLILYMTSGVPHHKNWQGIQRMCRSCNIEFEYTNSIERIKQNNYDILYLTTHYVDPYIVPNNIKIIYGPQFWVIPAAPIVGKFKDDLVGRCVFNSLSKWVGDYYLELGGELIMPLTYFPFAVDTDRFKPNDNINKDYDCLVYIKRRSNDLVNYTINLLNYKGLKYKIFKYGSYNEEEYINALHKCKFMLTLDAHESQGFALEEAMSSGVPLLVMDVQSMYDEMNNGIMATYNYLKPKKLLATSVPYWSDECGIKITEQSELDGAIDRMMSDYKSFTPRDYIVRTLSDEVCMRRILDYFSI
jgi:glycosyltransferase involved in cell wall biosynthesis